MLINIKNMVNSSVENSPYTYVVVNEIISLANVIGLVDTISEDCFSYVSRDEGSDKTYRVSNQILYSLEKQAPCEGLHNTWLSLISDITSKQYQQAIHTLLGVDVSHMFMEITLKKYQLNDYISPHTDRSLVPLTHILFLNERWEKEWGGDFCILESETKIAREIMPIWYNSVIFKQSKNSWHSVNRCLSPTANRIGLQIAFWLTQEKIELPGRYEQAT